ncbi:MAG: hypothetical protein ACTSQG_11080 [Promethearchaeota archaeon]
MSVKKNNYVPITIETNEILNQIDMFAYDFESLVRRGKHEIVFRSSDMFFIPKDGFCFCTPHFNLVETYEDFLGIINKLKDGGFSDPIEYEEAMRLEIHSMKEYKEFKKSDFYEKGFFLHNSNVRADRITSNINRNRRQYKTYLNAKEKGFKSEQDYNKAKKINCENSQLYFEFLDSTFYKERRYYCDDEECFEEFLIAKQKGFHDKETYKNACRLGFDDAIIYEQFIESGCENREEFEKVLEFQKSLPSYIQKEQNKIKEIKKDAKRALDSNFLGEYIRLSYLLLEKSSRLTYIKIYKIPLNVSNDLKIEEIIQKIEEKTKCKMVNYEELHKWRKLRNRIVHDHIKIDENTLLEAKAFFDQTISKLKNSILKLKLKNS